MRLMRVLVSVQLIDVVVDEGDTVDNDAGGEGGARVNSRYRGLRRQRSTKIGVCEDARQVGRCAAEDGDEWADKIKQNVKGRMAYADPAE